MTNLAAQEMLKRIARGLELNRKQFAKPSSKATASKATRGTAAKHKSTGRRVEKARLRSAHPAPEPVNAFAGGLITCPPVGVTFITASPR